MHRARNLGAGAGKSSPLGGSREIVVRAEDLAEAREVFKKEPAGATGSVGRNHSSRSRQPLGARAT